MLLDAFEHGIVVSKGFAQLLVVVVATDWFRERYEVDATIACKATQSINGMVEAHPFKRHLGELPRRVEKDRPKHLKCFLGDVLAESLRETGRPGTQCRSHTRRNPRGQRAAKTLDRHAVAALMCAPEEEHECLVVEIPIVVTREFCSPTKALSKFAI
jgi:hypothetical protein